MTYAAEIVDGVVARCIVGNAEWAAENLGGKWVDSEITVGIGWSWDGHSFAPPHEPLSGSEWTPFDEEIL